MQSILTIEEIIDFTHGQLEIKHAKSEHSYSMTALILRVFYKKKVNLFATMRSLNFEGQTDKYLLY